MTQPPTPALTAGPLSTYLELTVPELHQMAAQLRESGNLVAARLVRDLVIMTWAYADACNGKAPSRVQLRDMAEAATWDAPARLAEAERALAFYADERNYGMQMVDVPGRVTPFQGPSRVNSDKGDKARAALARLRGEDGEG